MKPVVTPVAAEVRQDTESEAALIQRVKESISRNNWTIGECASQWTARYAKGRTDDDFGAAVGMTGDQVYQRRRVHDRFRGVSDTYRNLSWSHFYAALTWDDAEACLDWACENYATVSEMKAWRTAQTGETDTYRNLDQPSGSGQSGEPDGDPFEGDDDPFGEGDSGEEDGTETGGKDSQENPTRPPRRGKDEPEGDAPQKSTKELFAEQKAKTVKTFEAASRAMADLGRLGSAPQKDAIIKSCHKAIETIKAYK